MLSKSLLCTLVLCASLLEICNGGVPKLDHRIVGGKPIDIRQVPYQISLRVYNSHICGGSLVSNQFVVTAAHCIHLVNDVNILTVQVGSSTLDWRSGIRVVQIIPHENYNPVTQDYDIALLKLAQPVVFQKNVSPIVPAGPADKYFVNDKAVVSGWGTLQEGGTISKTLQYVTVNLVDQKTCEAILGGNAAVTPRMLCAGVNGGGKDSCQGDSGGPLVSKGKLVGIVSWGYGCGRPNSPGVYSRVQRLVNWIYQNMKNNV